MTVRLKLIVDVGRDVSPRVRAGHQGRAEIEVSVALTGVVLVAELPPVNPQLDFAELAE